MGDKTKLVHISADIHAKAKKAAIDIAMETGSPCRIQDYVEAALLDKFDRDQLNKSAEK